VVSLRFRNNNNNKTVQQQGEYDRANTKRIDRANEKVNKKRS
jgi:hypothetical protein